MFVKIDGIVRNLSAIQSIAFTGISECEWKETRALIGYNDRSCEWIGDDALALYWYLHTDQKTNIVHMELAEYWRIHRCD